MQDIQPEAKLCQEPGSSLSHIPSDLLAYALSILRDKPLVPPEETSDQWSELVSILRTHWILPLFYWKVGILSTEFQPPESVTRLLRTAFLQNSARCLRLEQQLRDILNAFQEKSVRALVLRGPALAMSVYPDSTLRPCGDLDLLVLPKQIIKARAILERLGYKCLSKRFETAREFFREEEFVHKKNPRNNLLVDLHWVNWELHPFFASAQSQGVEDLFSRAHKVDSPALSFETFHPVDSLIQAAVHLTMIHGREIRLIWINDIALLAQQLRVPDDWEALQKRSGAWKARLAVENSLKMAQVLVGLQLPEKFNDFSKWPQPATDELVTPSHSTTRNWVTFLLKRYFSRPSGFLALARSLFHLLFPSPGIVRLTYPPSRDWLLPLSYVRRWHRWLMELIFNRIISSRKKE